MPRESLNREVGNPINKKAVRKLKLNLPISFPIRLEDIDPDRADTRLYLFYAFAFSMLSFGCLFIFSAAAQDMGLIVFVVAMLCVVILGRSEGQSVSKWMLPPILWSIALLPLNRLNVPLLLLFAVSGSLVLYTVALFRRHYKSVTIQTGWARLKRPKVKRTWSFLPLFDAIDSFLHYGRHGLYAPGMKASAAGSRQYRLLILTVTLLFLIFTFTNASFFLFPTYPNLSQDDLLLFIILLLIAHVSPLFLLIFSTYILSYFTLGRCYAIKLSESDPQRFAQAFPALCKELKRMREPKRKSLDLVFRGNVVADNSPILPEMSTQMTHSLFVGSTKSGKTASMLALVEQYMSRGDTSVVILDLKAFSYELYQSLLAVRKQAQKKFRLWHFTDAAGRSSHLFSLFDQEFWSILSPLQRSDLEQSAMGISPLRSYGPMWFFDVALAGLLYMTAKHPNVRHFAEQADRLAYEMKGMDMPEAIRRDGRQTQIILERLALTDSINRKAHYSKQIIAHQINLAQVYREPTALYAGLNTSLSPVAAPEIARLLLSACLCAGHAIPVPERKMNVVFVIDELQTIISSVAGVERALAQARALGISLHLSTQLFADFVQKDSDLTSTMLGNTATQSFHGVRDPLGIKILESISGTTIEPMVTRGIARGPNGATETVSVQEQLVNRIQENEILKASSEPDQFIMRICENKPTSYYDSLPFIARCPFHQTKNKYTKRQERPWPAPTPETLVNGESNDPPEPPAAPVLPPPPKPPVLTIEGLSDELIPKKGMA